MDASLMTSVLEEALAKYPASLRCNSDQSS